MAKKGNGRKDDRRTSLGLKTQTKHGILAVIFFVLAAFFLMSYFGIAGKAGAFFYEKLNYLLGYGYIMLPALFILLGASFIKSEVPDVGWARTISGILFLLSGLGIIDIASGTHAGGFFGEILSTPFMALFDTYASSVFLGAILIISILIMFDAKLSLALFGKIWSWIHKKKTPQIEDREEEDGSFDNARDDAIESEEKETAGEKIKNALGMGKKKSLEAARDDAGSSEEEEIPIKKRKAGLASTYVPPPLSLLEEDKGKPNT